ncbi:MAG: class I SAM-dependent methyltransferase [Fibrobacterales bacterium]
MSIIQSLYKKITSLKDGTVHLVYGRHHIRKWTLEHCSSLPYEPNILDIGCGKGDDLLGISDTLNNKCTLFGIEHYEPYRKMVAEKGITTYAVDIERAPLPLDDNTMDVISINQVLEHTKELFWILGEISRVLKPGGILIIGVPNLAAWHDRLLLIVGMEPSSCHIFGGHVRGITKPGLKNLLQVDDYFTVNRFGGSGFYPFPEFLAKPLAYLLPNFATSIFFCVKRTNKTENYNDILETNFFETNYYNGPKL